eukprot:CAMPEP_0167771616 /NCGR_PEP_ID=MMETSP0111_2-20121227/382_1 /TAXON_ID=91324 /ORGANISM="Lotharella globosa, Strain CCCM811" /LENGTH=472 /DNA_ID=CAMNT_0007660999 /DNA_START=133 /DNA_END=1548 /DNA_ORIENTATION=-
MVSLCLGEAAKRLKAARVLVVGAGGIGCELLKNLVLTGFEDIEVIDLDTIDLSNLNRQFLFRHQHIGHSKAKVARETVLKFNPKCKIIAHHGNIKDAKFDADYFKTFDIVLNALDNVGARQHVNRMCLATSKPLVESGTQGYLGQVQPILPGESACFECTPAAKQKTYAVCTIRSTPDKPVHCVVWAKHIFSVLFGPKDTENMLSDLTIPDMFDQNSSEAFERRAFRKLFHDEIIKISAEQKDWGDRVPPKPLDLEEVLLEKKDDNDEAKHQPAQNRLREQQVLSLKQNTEDFLSAVRSFVTERPSEIGQAVFDKDDDLAMKFISAVANIRMHIYGIPCQSRFAVKGIAGNIVHAIATTNAIAAGLIVMEAIKRLAHPSNTPQSKTTWIKAEGPVLLQPQSLEKKNSQCVICGEATMSITICTKKEFRLRDLYAVLKKEMNMIEPAINNLNGDFYGIEEDNDAKMLDRPLHT